MDNLNSHRHFPLAHSSLFLVLFNEEEGRNVPNHLHGMVKKFLSDNVVKMIGMKLIKMNFSPPSTLPFVPRHDKNSYLCEA
jgi:hypothetical protein